MPFLLDTCAVLYCSFGTGDLSDTAKTRLNAASHGDIFVSAVTIGEIACLVERRRLTLERHWRPWWHETLQRSGWTCLAITPEAMAEAYSLPPPIHRDPADRILIATARLERLTIVTTDRKILDYPHVSSLS